MKISALLWLKHCGEKTAGRVYSSKIYEIEFGDGLDYDHQADVTKRTAPVTYSSRIYAIESYDGITYSGKGTDLTKRRWARYGESSVDAEINVGSAALSISKIRSAKYIEHALLPHEIDAYSYVSSVGKHKNPYASFDGSHVASSIAVGISKNLAGHYLRKEMIPHEMDAGSVVVGMKKGRKSFDAESPAIDNVKASNVVSCITKNRHSMDGLGQPDRLRAYYGDVKTPTDLEAELLAFNAPSDLTATYLDD